MVYSIKYPQNIEITKYAANSWKTVRNNNEKFSQNKANPVQFRYKMFLKSKCTHQITQSTKKNR